MDRTLILETTFLVDLEREARRGGQGPAGHFLESIPDVRLAITAITAGEIAGGSKQSERAAWSSLVDRFDLLDVDREVAWRYGRLYRFLRDNGMLIGTNDLWIAATALVHDLPMVTRNADEFRRVPDLDVRSY